MKRKVLPFPTQHLQSYLNSVLSPLSKQTTFSIRKQNSRESSSKAQKIPRNQSKTLSFNNTISCEEITSSSWIVVDLETNKSMGHKINIEKQIASLTKIMTCIVVLERIEKYKLDTTIKIKVNKTASAIRGTTANLLEDSWINLNDLVYGLMLPSGNDAAWLLAQVFGLLLYYEKFKSKQTLYEDIESIDLSIYESTDSFMNYFLKQMNRKARSLSMNNTSFSNPHGLVDTSNYSSAKDISILCKYCLKNQKFVNIVNTKSYSTIVTLNNQPLETQWTNTNKLLDRGWMGIKTGKTVSAGACLASYKEDVLIIVLNSTNSEKRFEDTLKIYEKYRQWKKQEFAS